MNDVVSLLLWHCLLTVPLRLTVGLPGYQRQETSGPGLRHGQETVPQQVDLQLTKSRMCRQVKRNRHRMLIEPSHEHAVGFRPAVDVQLKVDALG